MKLKRILAAALAAAMMFLVACSGGGSSAGGAASTPGGEGMANSDYEPFRIGMITPLTGDNTFGGYEYKNGMELALEHMGGEINGRPIELVIVDGPTQEATDSEFERLYNQGVTVFMSGYGSINDASFAIKAEQLEVLYMSLCWDYGIVQEDAEYFFRVGANVVDFSGGTLLQAVSIGGQYLGKAPEDLRIALVYNTAIEAVVAPFKMYAESLGVQIVLEESYPMDTKDYVPIITKLMNTEYDILVPFQLATDGTPFQKKMFEMDYTPPLTIGAGIYYDTPVFADLGNELTNGILTQSYTTPAISDAAAPGVDRFRTDYEAKHGYSPLTHALQAYGNMFVLKALLEQVDPAEWENTALLAQTLAGLDLDYGEVPWYWGVQFENNENTRADAFIVCQWIEGNLEVVFPDELATFEAQIPYTG